MAKPHELLPKEQLAIQSVKSIIKRWVLCANKGECHVPLSDLRVVYSYRSGKDINQNAFGRMLTAQNVKVDIRRRNYFEPAPTSVRGLSVSWELPETELQALKAQLNMVENVTPIDKAS